MLTDQISLILYLPVAVGLCWWAGQIIAVEEWWGDTRRRFEDWAYRSGAQVRGGHPHAEEFWARAQPWLIADEPAPPRPAFVDSIAVPASLAAAKPARRVNHMATVARTKTADLIGCPRCAGWWGGLAAGLVFAAWLGPWDVTWGWLAAHTAGWGAARKLDWAHA